MLGAIIGDLVGSTYEANNVKTKDFPLLTRMSRISDDSIMTLAVCQIIQEGLQYDKKEIANKLKEWVIAFPDRGYGELFVDWALSDDLKPYGSYGNGAAMRISPVGWYAKTKEEVKEWSKNITEVTHNTKEAIKAAEVVAMCIFYARKGKSKEYIKEYASKYYDLDLDYEDLVDDYQFDCSCEGSVPEAIYCFLISTSFLDCLRTAISIGGDSDTIACIACSIAEAYYKHINPKLLEKMHENIPEGMPNPVDVIDQFMYDMEDDFVTSEALTDKHYIIYVEDEGSGFYGHSKRLIVLKDYIISRLERSGFDRIRRIKALLKEVDSFTELKALLSDINELASDYDISFKLYQNRIEANL